jgi:predicted phage terminase large subunit-like protein
MFARAESLTAVVMSVDPGMTPGSKNSFSAIQLWCPNGNNHYLVNQWREQCDFAVLRSLLLRYFKRYRPSAILIERTANGPALNSMMTHKLQEIIHEVIPKGSKTSRLRRNIDTILARKIVLPESAAWRAEFIAEFVAFPHGDFTDQVDATTQYLDWIGGNPLLERPPQPGLCAGIGFDGRQLSTNALSCTPRMQAPGIVVVRKPYGYW